MKFPLLFWAVTTALVVAGCAGIGQSGRSDIFQFDVPHEVMQENIAELMTGMGMDIHHADYSAEDTYLIIGRRETQASGRYGRSTHVQQLNVYLTEMADGSTQITVRDATERVHYGGQAGTQNRENFLRLLRQQDYPPVGTN